MALFPLVPVLQTSLDIRTAAIGLIAAAGFVGALVAELALAPLADRGRARMMAVGGLALMTGALVGSAAAADAIGLAIGRGVGGVGTGLFMAAASALLVRADPARSGELLGRLGAAELAGVALGPLASGVALSFAAPSAILIVVGAVVALGIVPAALAFRERGSAPSSPVPADGALASSTPAPASSTPVPVSPPAAASPPAESGAAPPRISLDLLRSRRVVGVALLYAAVMVPTGAYDGIWPRYMADIGADPVLTAASYALFAVPFVLLAGWAGRLADHRGGVGTFARGLAWLLPIISLYGIVSNPWLATGMGFLESSGQALAFVGAAAAMAQATPAARAGSAQGLLRAAGLVAATVAAAASGVVYETGGPILLFGGTAAAVAAVAATGLLLTRGTPARPGSAAGPRTRRRIPR